MAIITVDYKTIETILKKIIAFTATVVVYVTVEDFHPRCLLEQMRNYDYSSTYDDSNGLVKLIEVEEQVHR